MPFDMGKALGWSTVHLSAGKATYSPFDRVLVDGLAIPRKIHFQSGGGPQPWLTIGIELVDDSRPECTYLELDADGATPVRDKHLKLIHIEKWVNQIVRACSDPVQETSATERTIGHGGPVAGAQAKAIERMQRRRRDPNDRELMEQVAAVYKDNPDKPIQAIMRALDMSESTAKRWARRCSDAGLLAKVSKRGQKRI